MFYSTNYSSPPGEILLASDGDRLAGLWLDKYFFGRKPAVSDLPLAPLGGEFRQSVWKILCGIPYGGVTAYGRITGKIAAQMNKKVCPVKRWAEP